MPYRYDFIPGAMDHEPGAVSWESNFPNPPERRAVTLQKLGQGTLDSKHHLGWLAANYKQDYRKWQQTTYQQVIEVCKFQV